MELRKCTCGAIPDVREKTETTADGQSHTVYWVSCPVCGQLGPRISGAGKSKEAAVAEAIAAWNDMIAGVRPAEV